ncbi:hypothetical protein K432DRAFT_425661 [Lepidopterella palustris CBS 459.81]|uniref:Reverse transcriptase domain-containing protein n=1 Tax=Lepidopterella palustris CBS 459.81 TaxID=1314670 RepID=A0A8E2EB38_9PEZI|nr:hypothetical protein K432DRAFT_425661 [Lepidopterella palustris CBS 459.81]
MASAVVSTLGHVTERKLGKLAEQQKTYGKQRKAILEAVEEQPDPAEKVRALIDGLKEHGIPTDRLGTSIENIKRFIDQSRVDSSVSKSLLKDWQSELEQALEVEGVRYDFAALFGRLVMEWIQNPNTPLSSSGSHELPEDGDESSDDASSTSFASASFEQVGREEMHRQRKEWESYAFTERNTDEAAINKFLHGLFDSTLKSKKIQQTPLQVLRKAMANFSFESQQFDQAAVQWCISGLLKNDLFSGKKREVLVDLQNRPTVLKEMADVLNMDLASLESWEWAPVPVPLNMRRQLNGKYRVYMDEEIHQAILLQFIGSHWAVHLKSAFTSFYHSGAWIQSPFVSMSKKHKIRRQFFLGNAATPRDSVRNARRRDYQESYFMTQLPSSVFEGCRDYQEGESDEALSVDGTGETKAPLAIKQSMLRLATTEMLINRKLYGKFTILQSDFKCFGPSMPHPTIFTVLKFFGVADKWLNFFKKYLEAPLAFAQDGPGAEPLVRKCGIPMSHVLSDVLSEAVLFCLDFTVNQRTKGANLYRFHDDLWFWGQESVCIDAWNAIEEFSNIMGLELNKEKTGAAMISADPMKDQALSPALPKGQIHWGFLSLDRDQGSWKIDPEKITEHIDELRRQLAACRSVLAWVQAWNGYVDRFFSTNFGQPANCFGRSHVDMIIATYQYIQNKLFADTPEAAGSVTEYLRKQIKERFDVDNIPDGFFYFPNELGGLELRNPFIRLLAVRKRCKKDPLERIDIAFEYEEEEYEAAKKYFDEGKHVPRMNDSTYAPRRDEPFMSLEEFVRFREETSNPLHRAYTYLMVVPLEDELDATPEVTEALKALPSGDWGKSGFNKDWRDLSPYWKWVVQLYAGDMVKRFGGLSMGDRGLLPIGLLSMLRSEKVRWQG